MGRQGWVGGNIDSEFVTVPVKIPLSEEISEIFAGLRISMFLSKTGNLYACGEIIRGSSDSEI
jgi:alpha-tubulin suppressor-like RCC1 family protein